LLESEWNVELRGSLLLEEEGGGSRLLNGATITYLEAPVFDKEYNFSLVSRCNLFKKLEMTSSHWYKFATPTLIHDCKKSIPTKT